MLYPSWRMHIPDGYLSPSTCATLYLAAAPFWFVSLRKLKAALNTRMIPLVSVFASFSFVIMMFNLPLPGGTTGHAVGMGIAAIVLGPWASIIAVSVALLIQALFFGDGGITAIGANCFNMAIVGSLAAYGAYRLLALRSPIDSSRRALAAGLAGYLGINAAALFAAVEFGIQPLLFVDPTGAPLYCPYPLKVAVPAMMIGHLTFAGLAEFIISAGIVAYLQKADPALLGATAGRPPEQQAALWTTARKLWIGVAALLVLTPLGILAVGSAWGEWSAQDFSDPQARRWIEAATAGQTAPIMAPKGLQRLSSLWSAPVARYAPAFIPNQSAGYVVSALVGVGAIGAIGFVSYWFARRRGKRRRSFVEKTARSLLRATEHALFAENLAQGGGLLQTLDARAKFAGIGALIIASIAVRRIEVLAALFCVTIGLALASRIRLRFLAQHVWMAVLAFTGVIAVPAIFLTPGSILARLPLLEWDITAQGIHSASLLVLRAETAATLSILLILTTLWTHVLRALRWFRVPVVLVVILGMTFRYIFLFLQTARDMFESREARMVGKLAPPDSRRLMGASAGVLLGKSVQLSSEVHMAMQARGFRGEVYLLDDPNMPAANWLPLASMVAAAGAAVWIGR